MKKYTKPRIRAVLLDSKQAILQICKTGGIYFTSGSAKCSVISGTVAPVLVCTVSVKSVINGGGWARNTTADAMPS